MMIKGPYFELTCNDGGWALMLYRPDAEPIAVATLVDMAVVKSFGQYLDWIEEAEEADAKGERMYQPIPPGQEGQYPLDSNQMDFPFLEVRNNGRLSLYPTPVAAPLKIAAFVSPPALEALKQYVHHIAQFPSLAWGVLIKQAIDKGLLEPTGEHQYTRTRKNHVRRTPVYRRR
jgi:hypothetical protein